MFRLSRKDTFDNHQNLYEPVHHMQMFNALDKYAYRRTSTPVRFRDVKTRPNNSEGSEKSSYEAWKFNLHRPPKQLKVRGVSKPLPGIISGHIIKTEYIHIVNGKVVEGNDKKLSTTRRCANCEDSNCLLNPKIKQQNHVNNLFEYLHIKFSNLSVKNRSINKNCYCRPLDVQNILDDYVIIQ